MLTLQSEIERFVVDCYLFSNFLIPIAASSPNPPTARAIRVITLTIKNIIIIKIKLSMIFTFLSISLSHYTDGKICKRKENVMFSMSLVLRLLFNPLYELLNSSDHEQDRRYSNECVQNSCTVNGLYLRVRKDIIVFSENVQRCCNKIHFLSPFLSRMPLSCHNRGRNFCNFYGLFPKKPPGEIFGFEKEKS